MKYTKITYIHIVKDKIDSLPSKLEKLAFLIFKEFDIYPQGYKSYSRINDDKINSLSLRNIDLTIRISPIVELNSYILTISFIPEMIEKDKLLSLLNEHSEYFINLEEILDNYHSDPNNNNNNIRMLYYASFSGADLPDERIFTIFKRILNEGDKDQILFLCASVIIENTLYYDIIKEPLQEALAKTNIPVLTDTYKDVLTFIDNYS